MTLVIVSAGTVILEGLVHLTGRWPKLRYLLVLLTAAILLILAPLLIIAWPNVFSTLIALLCLYRIVNLLRFIKRRMHETYLRHASRRTSLALIGAQALMLLLWLGWSTSGITSHPAWISVTSLQAVVALVLLLSTARTLRRTRWPEGDMTPYSDKELPSVTVAIPARDETDNLKGCLESVLASNYPKLEVIVFDDTSQPRHAPEILRSFAQDGVRFLKGEEPNLTWLPKNQAYAQLAHEASGAYIVFCGVDVRFNPQSIRRLVIEALNRHKQMVCVLPMRDGIVRDRSSIIQAIRYLWELSLPRRNVNRPPVLSTCWIVNAQALHKTGSFASVARAVVPEAYFARQFIKEDGYSFLRSSASLGVESIKGIRAQRATAVRMRYPQLHRRPEQVALTSVIESMLLLLPLVIFIAGFWVSIGLMAHLLALTTVVLLIVVYALVTLSTHVNTWPVGLTAQPLAIAIDILLLNYSMLRYEFTTVDWKGREVGAPVMHAAHQFQGEETLTAN